MMKYFFHTSTTTYELVRVNYYLDSSESLVYDHEVVNNDYRSKIIIYI
jgi:hypothetical protein